MNHVNLKKICQIGIINTIRINLYYFGFGGVVRPRIIASKYVKINQLKGSVHISNGRVHLGLGQNGLCDNKYSRTVWENTGNINFFGNCHLGPGTKIINHGDLEFGNSFCVAANSSIICYDKIKFGDNVLVSWDCIIMDTDFHKIINNSTTEVSNNNKPIQIGNKVWICMRSLVLKGTSISNDCVIAAGSIVTKDLKQSNSIYKSNKQIKENICWEE